MKIEAFKEATEIRYSIEDLQAENLQLEDALEQLEPRINETFVLRIEGIDTRPNALTQFMRPSLKFDAVEIKDLINKQIAVNQNKITKLTLKFSKL